MATPLQIIQKLAKLQSVLLTSGLQQKDQPLYQVINQLIKAISEALESVLGVADTGAGGIVILGNGTFLTVDNELATLPNSSQLVAGDHVSFDTSVFGQLRIDILLDFITNATLLTATDQSADFPNSRQLLAGDYMTFDDTVANERTINGTGGTAYYDSPLSDGDPSAAELIFADGECIIVQVPNVP